MGDMKIPFHLLAEWKVIIIDDEPDSLEVAEIMLSSYGANVFTAKNGLEGLALIRHVHPHFVISDISMPVMDGWELIEELKNDRALMDIPVIALTAHAMIGDRHRAIAAGFHNYLTKPLTLEHFLHDLLNLLMDIPELAKDLQL